MTTEDKLFLKELLIKLDISIEAEHEKASSQGLMLIFDFTEEKRKADMLKALDILSKEDIPDELYIMPARANGKPTATIIKIKEAMNKVAINELTDLKDKIINGTYPLASNDLINIIDEKIKKLVEVKL